MSVQLLDKTRKINKLLHNNNSQKVVFNDICKILSDILLSNILVISKKGKVLGVGLCSGVDEIEELIEECDGEEIIVFRTIPLYDVDGITILDEYNISFTSINGF